MTSKRDYVSYEYDLSSKRELGQAETIIGAVISIIISDWNSNKAKVRVKTDAQDEVVLRPGVPFHFSGPRQIIKVYWDAQPGIEVTVSVSDYERFPNMAINDLTVYTSKGDTYEEDVIVVTTAGVEVCEAEDDRVLCEFENKDTVIEVWAGNETNVKAAGVTYQGKTTEMIAGAKGEWENKGSLWMRSTSGTVNVLRRRHFKS